MLKKYQVVTKKCKSIFVAEGTSIVEADTPFHKFEGHSIAYFFDFLDLNYPEYTISEVVE